MEFFTSRLNDNSEFTHSRRVNPICSPCIPRVATRRNRRASVEPDDPFRERRQKAFVRLGRRPSTTRTRRPVPHIWSTTRVGEIDGRHAVARHARRSPPPHLHALTSAPGTVHACDRIPRSVARQGTRLARTPGHERVERVCDAPLSTDCRRRELLTVLGRFVRQRAGPIPVGLHMGTSCRPLPFSQE